MRELLNFSDRPSWRYRLHLAAAIATSGLLMAGILWIYRDALPQMWTKFGNDPVRLLLFVAVLIGSIYAWFAGRQQLRITPGGIELESRLPDLLKTRFSDWSIRTREIVEIRLVARQPHMPMAYRIRIQTKRGKFELGVFSWMVRGGDEPAGPQRPFRSDHLMQQARETALARMMEECGHAVTWPDSPPPASELETTPQGRALIFATIGLMVIATVASLFGSYRYLSSPPWPFIVCVGIIGAGLAIALLARLKMKAAERVLAALLLGAAAGFAGSAAALYINTLGAGPEILYRFDGGVFRAVDSDAPEIWVGSGPVQDGKWRDGDTVMLPAHRGLLGFWQYDRNEAVKRIRKGP